MKRILPLLTLLITISAPCVYAQAGETDRVSKVLFDQTVFYDGYKTDEVVDAALDDGIFRYRNHTYLFPLTEAFCRTVGDNVKLDIVLGALCDNYDRFGNISIVFVPKGEEMVNPENFEKIEIARYITPFMNKRKNPKEVPYEYYLPDLGLILHDPDIHAKYDLWLEAYLFGVPYAANKEILGCQNRNDVFKLTTTLTYDPAVVTENLPTPHHVVPIATVRTEEHGNVNFNNYNEQATDTIGKTTKTWKFVVPANVTDSKIVLINTNHGADVNGEEYVRRQHLVYVDGEIAMVYTPGGISCEPYRQYNTQGNGIYGAYPKPDSQWEWNNWCPGQAVPIREIPLSGFSAGEHSVMIRVPDAEFYGQSGDFRPALYFQGVEDGVLPSTYLREHPEAGLINVESDLEWSNDGNVWYFNTPMTVTEARVYTYDGKLVYGEYNPSCVDMNGCAPGYYIITLTSAEGANAFRKVIVP